jgi:actin-binding protein anillin
MRNSPIREHLHSVENEDGGATPASDLIHTVSFYRKQRGPNVTVTPHAKIIRKVIPSISEEVEDENSTEKDDLEERIKKLQTEVEEQTQRRMQASKALEICASKNEFEGSYERVEFERLLLEAHHKYAAATTEMNRLKTEGARRMSASGRQEMMKKSSTKGAISISGISLPLKADFIRLMSSMPDQDTVHYFLCLVKYRSQVIATQMLSTLDGISARKNKLVFTNLINVNELDFDFQIYLEVYGLQTPRERLSHEAKYHIRKEKSMFNLTPLKKLKKQEFRTPGNGRENPVNSLTIRKSKFGLVGYTTITIDTLKNRNYRLQKVPPRSPLDDGLEMKLNVYSESRVEERGFLTAFMDVNGLGNWCRRWCLLKDNTLHFWKYPEDESKVAPSEQISLHDCFTDLPVSLAPREVCSRLNTFMLEAQRRIQQGDRDALNMHVDRKHGVTILRHLLSADTRDERISWCHMISKALVNLRAWDPTSCKPLSRSDSLSSTSTATSTDGGIGQFNGDTISSTNDATDNDDNTSAASTDIW